MIHVGIIIIFIISVIKSYFITERFHAKSGLRTWILAITFVLLEAFAYITPFSNISTMEYAMVIVYIMTDVAIYKRRGSLGGLLFLLFLQIEVETVTEGVLNLILFIVKGSLSKLPYFVVVQIISFIVIMGIAIGMRYSVRSSEELKFSTSWKIYSILLFIVSLIISFVVSCLRSLESYYSSTRYHVAVMIITIAAGVAVCFLILMAFYLQRMNALLNQHLENERELRKMQQRYQELVQEKEDETRRFRHDMSGHLLHLSILASEEKSSVISEYLTRLNNELLSIQKYNIQTGNKHLDILMNYYLSKFDNTVKIEYTGQMNLHNSEIDEYDLCIVITNLMTNIMDEFVRIGEDLEKTIRIEIEQGTEFYKMIISNTVEKNKIGKSMEEILKSQKKNPKDHGYGIYNIRQAIQRMSGSYNNRIEQGMYITEITLPF